MRLLKFSLLVLCGAIVLFSQVRIQRAKPAALPDRPFDEYGRIAWDHEKARLDNFAIQITNEPDAIGYIFVCDGKEMCAGEAELRAARAKRYIVEHRGVPWNRVIWRKDGYCGEFKTMLQPVRRGVTFPYPFLGPIVPSPEVHVTDKCKARIAQIKKSKWN